jgi:hypothetical protein
LNLIWRHLVVPLKERKDRYVYAVCI